ncbi:hypothetical protein VNO77_30044 [Canavalia gladiata]|uniref:Uncharacterized protein n=1 Tax=Canavalia gladiata TaxID=3824 RepID=A0AAN9Q172_CANGL
MEWCSHCCRLCPTRLESICGDFSVKSCCVCTLCGKLLLDLNASLQVIFPNKNTNKNSRRMKRERKIKHGIQTQNEECLNGLIHNVLCGCFLQDTSQISENIEEA